MLRIFLLVIYHISAAKLDTHRGPVWESDKVVEIPLSIESKLNFVQAIKTQPRGSQPSKHTSLWQELYGNMTVINSAPFETIIGRAEIDFTDPSPDMPNGEIIPTTRKPLPPLRSRPTKGPR